jgi:hypothetical protein
MAGTALPNIVLLSQKDPTKEVELTSDEGPSESWMAVAQDMWGVGNLTPFDNTFASRAIGTMAPTQNAALGAICYQLGKRLFTFSRDSNIWIDAWEGEPILSRVMKRPKDKVKLAAWSPDKNQLGKSRLTHIAILSPSRLAGPHDKLVHDAAHALKKAGSLFLADLMRTGADVAVPGMGNLHTDTEYRGWLEAAGLKLYSTHDMTGDVRLALLLGLHNSLNMLANVRKLHNPWRMQRFNAFRQELELAVSLHGAFERGEVVATGLYYTKT